MAAGLWSISRINCMVGCVVALVACGPSANSPGSAGEADPAAALRADGQTPGARAWTVEDEGRRIDADLAEQPLERIRTLLQACKTAIRDKARQDTDAFVAIAVIDESSPDRMQADAFFGGVSPATLDSQDKRVRDFDMARNLSQLGLHTSLNTGYAVLYLYPAPGGPLRRTKTYRCQLRPGLGFVVG